MRHVAAVAPTPAEVVALVRLAEHGSSIPPHLTQPLVAKGWVMITAEGNARLTLRGLVLVGEAQTIDLDALASTPVRLAPSAVSAPQFVETHRS